MRLPYGALALLLANAAPPAAAQTVLDWPLLLEARPVPLVTGAGGVLGSPAGLAFLAPRAEGLVSDLETPEVMGLRAVTLAAALRVYDGWTVGAAYRHIGLGDMLRTDGPPMGGVVVPFEVGEDVFALAVGRRFGPLAAGASARLDAPAADLGGDDAWSGTVGATYAPTLPVVALRMGGMLELGRDDARLAAAAELAVPPLLANRLTLAVAYGTRDTGTLGFSHTVVATGIWQGTFELQMGVDAQPGAHGTTLAPAMAALVHVGRYDLGIVREALPNDFGAALHYRLGVSF